MPDMNISADMTFPSKYIEVLGSKIHSVDEGTGDPIIFLHGNPVSCERGNSTNGSKS